MTMLVLAGCITCSEGRTWNIRDQQGLFLALVFGPGSKYPKTIAQKRDISLKRHLCTMNIILNIFILEQTKVLYRRHIIFLKKIETTHSEVFWVF